MVKMAKTLRPKQPIKSPPSELSKTTSPSKKISRTRKQNRMKENKDSIQLDMEKYKVVSPKKTKSKKSQHKCLLKVNEMDSELTPKLISPEMTKSKKSQHKSLLKLKEMDPEFYKFLETEDKDLLELSDSAEDEQPDYDSETDTQKGGIEKIDEEAEVQKIVNDLEGMESSDDESPVHKLPDKLEEYDIPSDSDDDEDAFADEEMPTEKESRYHGLEKTGIRVSLAVVKRWTKLVQEKATFSLLHDITQSLKLLMSAVTNQTEDSTKSIEDSSVLNSLLRMCLDHMLPMLLSLLHLTDTNIKLDRPSIITQSKGWKRIRLDVKSYLADLLKVLAEMTQANTIDAILKHVLSVTTFYSCFPVLARNLLKRLIKFWSEGGETTRVIAFLCISRIVRINTDTLIDIAIKKMYMAYVQNCKFTSPTTLPVINFMQRTLVEVFSIRLSVTYQYAFVYIRQLAIHLRNAITNHKAEQIAAVYNWQYVHSAQLWVRVLTALCPGDCLDALIYPLTQTLLGVLKLVPTHKFYPLRFHCIRSLTQLSASLNVFIPILPFIIEVFEQTDFNRRHKSISAHPINFATILKLSKSQLSEKAFKDGVIDQLYELLLEYFNANSHDIAFPELVLPVVLQLKDFLKKCKVANYCKQMRQILDKVQESSNLIVERRRHVTFMVSDTKAIEEWNNKLKVEGTPISKYYKTWRELRDRELQHEISGKDRLLDNIDIPEVDRSKFKQKATDEERKEFAALFDADSGEESDTERFKLKEERKTKKKKASDVDSDDSNQYSDFDSDELEQLAGSADDDSSEEDTEGNGKEESEENISEDDDPDSKDFIDSEAEEAETDEEKYTGKDIMEEIEDEEDMEDRVEDLQLSEED